MKVHDLLYNHQKLRTLWRILLFVSLFSVGILPLFLITNNLLQFLGATLILLFVLYISSKYIDKRKYSEYGLVFKKETITYFLFGFLIGFISVALIFLIGKITGIIKVSNDTSTLNFKITFLFAIKMFLVSILEETFFRGYLFTNFQEGFKFKKISRKQVIFASLILSSILFGFAHFSNNNSSILSILLLGFNGIVWCIPFILTKSLGLSIGMHMAWNFTQTIIGFTMSGNKSLHSLYNISNNASDIMTGGEYGPEAGILGLIGFMFMLFLSIIYLRLTKKITFQL